MWLLVMVLVANFLLLGGPYAETTQACSCAGTSNVEEELRASDAVFSGEMVRDGIEDPEPGDGAMFGGIEFRVDESWKGVSGESAVVYGQSTAYYGELDAGDIVTESSCAYPFEKGENYLVYADRYEDGFRVEPCSGTAPLDDAGEDLRALGAPADRLTDTGGPPLPAIVGAALALLAAATLAARSLRRD
jgi:hypothetical protein